MGSWDQGGISNPRAKGLAMAQAASGKAQTLPTKVRKNLAAQALFVLFRSSFARFSDRRSGDLFSLPDACLSGFALFSLKDPSLLAFDGRRNDANLKRVFGIERVPSDTQMREILDQVDPLELRPAFNDVFRELQRGKVLEHLVFHDECYLLCLDGTGYFSSQKIHCPSCLQKVNSTTGEITYSHQIDRKSTRLNSSH